MYLSSYTNVLMANGHYKNISKIQPGDYVLNISMAPTKVVQVVQQPDCIMNEVRYTNWYMPLYGTPDLQVLTSTPAENTLDFKVTNMQWTLVKDLSDNCTFTSEREIYQNIFAEMFNISFITNFAKNVILQPTYKLGILFGMYAGYGSVNKNRVEFRFGPNEELVLQVSQIVKELLNAESRIEKDEFCYKVIIEADHATEIFTEFGSKIERRLPQKYWSCNLEYVRGLFEGLIEYDPESDICRYIPVTHDMAQVFLWVCSLMGLSFENDTPTISDSKMQVYPLFLKLTQEDTGFGRFTSKKVVDEMGGWNLIVECPTTSFIANNLVVKSLPQVPEPVPVPTPVD